MRRYGYRPNQQPAQGQEQPSVLRPAPKIKVGDCVSGVRGSSCSFIQGTVDEVSWCTNVDPNLSRWAYKVSWPGVSYPTWEDDDTVQVNP